MIQLPSKNLTLEEFLQLPETKPASEYIDGQIIQKPMPQGKNSTIGGEILSAINAVVKKKKSLVLFPNCVVLLADVRSYLIYLYFFGIEFLAMTGKISEIIKIIQNF